jgi:hypothetical protein
MSKKIFAIAILPLLAGLGCSKPAPPPPIRPITQQDLKNLSQSAENAQKEFAASEKLYEELKKEKAAQGSATNSTSTPNPAVTPSPDMTPGSAITPGRPIASVEELSALIQKAGYTPHSNDASKMRYFVVTSNPSVTKLGFPGGMKILYFLSDDKKSFTFFAVIRELRQSEGNDVSQATTNAPLAPALISKLKTADPMPQKAIFMATNLPVMASGETVVAMPYLLLAMSAENRNMDPGTVQAEINNIVAVLGTTQLIWK